MKKAIRCRLSDPLFDRSWDELSELELLSLLLIGQQAASRPVTREQAVAQAHRLLCRVGSIGAIGGCSVVELMESGLGEAQAVALKAADRLFRRVAGKPLSRGQAFSSSREVFEHFRPRLSHLRKECFWVLLLDGKNRLLRLERIAEGILTAALAHPREVFRPAVQRAAAGILCVHNHPSGDPQPSHEDIELTRRLSETGRVVGIRLLDHVVVSDQSYFSFADQGMI